MSESAPNFPKINESPGLSTPKYLFSPDDKSSTKIVEEEVDDKGMDLWHAVEMLLYIQFGNNL